MTTLETTKTKVAEYAASFNESNRYQGNPQLLDQIKQLYSLLDEHDKHEFDKHINDKNWQAMPMAFVVKKACSILLGTVIGCVSLPIIDAYAGGANSFPRMLVTGMAGGWLSISLMNRLGMNQETHARLRALRPYIKISAATQPLSSDDRLASRLTVYEELESRVLESRAAPG